MLCSSIWYVGEFVVVNLELLFNINYLSSWIIEWSMGVLLCVIFDDDLG